MSRAQKLEMIGVKHNEKQKYLEELISLVGAGSDEIYCGRRSK